MFFQCSPIKLKIGVAALIAVSYVVGLSSPAVASITVNSASTYAEVFDSSASTTIFDEKFDIDGAIAVADLTSQGFLSTTTSTFGPLMLQAEFAQERAGDFDDSAYGDVFVVFTVDQTLSYLLGGQFMNLDNGTGFGASLYDVTGGGSILLFDNFQFDVQPGGKTLTLGNDAGNSGGLLAGSLTGSLTAGRVYEWRTYAETSAAFEFDPGTTASGYSFLQLGGVPEPTSLMIWSGIGLVGLVARRRRRR